MGADDGGPTEFRARIAGATTDHRFLLLGVVAVAVAILGAVVVSKPSDGDDEPAVALQASPSPARTAAASAAPSPEASLPPETAQSFASDLYGYSLRYPAGWTATPATTAWVGNGSRSLGANKDVFRSSGGSGYGQASDSAASWFAVAAVAMPDGSSVDEWIDGHVPPRDEYEESADGGARCVYLSLGNVTGGGRITPVRWQDGRIGARAARIRAGCGFVDGVVVAAGRLYHVSMFTRREAYTDMAAFAAIADTIVFRSPPPDGSTTFTSDLYDYSIQLDGRWTATPATSPWEFGSTEPDWWKAPGADAFDAARGDRFTVTATRVPIGTSATGFAGTYLSARSRLASGRYTCAIQDLPNYGRGTVPGVWRDDRIAGQPGRVRGECGYVDGVVVVGDRAFVFSMYSDLLGGGDFETFFRLADTMAFGVTSSTFTSRLYDFTITLPSGWDREPATTPWSGSGAWWEGPSADVLSGPTSARFAVAAVDVPEDLDIRAWAAEHVPARPEYEKTQFGPECLFRSAKGGTWYSGAPNVWMDGNVAGQPARIRVQCGSVDAVLLVGTRAYVLSSFTYKRADGNLEQFQALADLITFGGTPRRFTSPLYGYSIAVQTGWHVTAATTPWAGSGPWFVGPAADRIAADGPEPFTVAAVDVLPSMTVEGFAAANVPTRAVYKGDPGGHAQCVYRNPAGGTTIIDDPYPPTWHEVTIGGHPGLARGVCGYVDGVVIVDGGAYVFSMFGRKQAAGDLVAFQKLTDTVTFGIPVTGSGGTFTSSKYGYSIRYPLGWLPTPATEPWTGAAPVPGGPGADVLSSGQFGRFSVVSIDVPAATDIDAWIVVHVPPPPEFQMYDGKAECDWMLGALHLPRSSGAGSDAWGAGIIGGEPARIRSVCGRVDGVAMAAGSAFVFSYADGSRTPDGDVDAFRSFVDTVNFRS